MMERLRDQTSSSDPVTARAAVLLSAMPPLDTSRLRTRVLPPPLGRRLAGVRFRTGLVFAVTLGTAAAAAAALHSWPLNRAPDASMSVALSAISSPVPSPSSERGSRPNAPPAPAIDVPSHVAGTAPGTGSDNSNGTSEQPSRAPAKASLSVARAPQREIGTVEDESTLIVRAVRALRRDGEPARAQALAEQSLAKFPHGAQVEEAMALVMEAASARGDAPDAQRAAASYLDRYPSGRFVDRAQRILASPAK
jgi:hypothetical protein